jgi:hypothetical protein
MCGTHVANCLLRRTERRAPLAPVASLLKKRRRWESNPLAPGCSRLPGHPAPASSVSSSGVEPDPRPSQGRMPSATPRGQSTPPRNRTSSRSFEDCCAVRHTRRARNYPDLDSNQGLDFRRVPCLPLHHRDDSRADGWIRTSMRRFTGPLPFSVEPRRQKQERKDSNPVERLWRPPALPGAHSCPQGCLRGIEPAASTFTASHAFRLHHRHHLFDSSPGWIRTSALPHVTGMSLSAERRDCSIPRPGFEPGTPS